MPLLARQKNLVFPEKERESAPSQQCRPLGQGRHLGGLDAFRGTARGLARRARGLSFHLRAGFDRAILVSGLTCAQEPGPNQN